MKKDCIISIDLGGTKILAAAINSKQGIIASIKKETPVKNIKRKIINNLAGIVEDVIEEFHLPRRSVKAICVGVPGSVNPFTGRIGIAPNLGLKNFSIGPLLSEKVNYPVLIENDVNLGALGIKNYGVGSNAVNMLAVFIGTGIGGGLIFNNKIYRGTRFVAGEIGHITVEENGYLCGCGNRGCFETVASRTAIVRNIVKDIKGGKKSILSKPVKSGERIKSRLLLQAVEKHDKVAVKRLNEAGAVIGKTLAGIANLLNVDMIVLGGGVIEAMGKYMLPEIKKSFNKYVMKDASRGLKIVSSHLGDNAALYGGLALAKEFLDVNV